MCFYSIENDMQNFRHFCKKKKNTSGRHLAWFCTQPFNFKSQVFGHVTSYGAGLKNQITIILFKR